MTILGDYNGYIKEVKVPSWDEYYLEMVEIVKKRSQDANTNHACILVDEKHRIVATGYNSFPTGFPDAELPNYRPTQIDPKCPKYHFMVHSEENAVCNLTTRNYNTLTCYITGTPCVRCLRLIYQAGVRRIVMTNNYGWQFSSDEKPYFDEIVYCGNIQIETLTQKYEFGMLETKWGNRTGFNWVDK